MAFGFHSRPSHIAQNIIVGLDFDGTVSYSAHLRVAYAKKYFRTAISLQQTTREKWPEALGEDKYWEAALAADNDVEEHIPAPGCKEVLMQLHSEGFRFAIVTARKLPDEAYKAINKLNIKRGNAELLEQAAVARFISAHHLPVDYVHHVKQTPNDTKDYLCWQLHARAFIDDSLKYLVPLRGTFVKPFFILQPWNIEEAQNIPGSGITPVTNWYKFGKELLYIKQMHEAICYFSKWQNAYFNLPKIDYFWKSNPELCNRHFEDYRKEEALAGARK